MKFLVIASASESLVGFRKPLIVDLMTKGFDVHVAAPELVINATVLSQLETFGVTAHDIQMQRTGMNPFADLKALLSMWRLMRQLKPDYVLSYTIKPVIYGSLAAWLAHVPNRFALITGLGFAFMGDGRRSRVLALVQTLYRAALRHCQVIFFQNPDDEALFRQSNILTAQANTCVVNGSGVDVGQFSETAFVDTEVPRFLLIARLLGDKGVREYVQAARQIKQKYPNIQFDLVGGLDANPTSISQDELDEWVAAGTVNFLGRLSDVRPAIEASSVYVLPSYREGTPRTVLEAMAMGRAVITTDAPGCRETVIDGDNGFLVSVKNADALSQAMEKFIQQPKLIASMGKRSREIAVEKYDVHKVNDVMLRRMGFD